MSIAMQLLLQTNPDVSSVTCAFVPARNTGMVGQQNISSDGLNGLEERVELWERARAVLCFSPTLFQH